MQGAGAGAGAGAASTESAWISSSGLAFSLNLSSRHRLLGGRLPPSAGFRNSSMLIACKEGRITLVKPCSSRAC